jgi:hypothetical protein
MKIFKLFTIMAQYRNRFMHSNVYSSGETTVNRDRSDIRKTGYGRQTRTHKKKTTTTKQNME